MLKIIRLLPALLLLTFAALPAVAQDTGYTGWPVEEHCLGEPTTPPKGWTYNGTILMTGNSGIHGVKAAWDTPRVLTFLNDNDLWGGALSPDGMRYASPRGNFTITNTYNGITEIDELRVSSVDGQRNHFSSLKVEGGKYTFFQYTHAQVYWRDNENFLYANTQFNINTGEIADWPTPERTFPEEATRHFSFAPDWTRWIFTGNDDQLLSIWRLGDLTQNKVLGTLDIVSPIIWKPDSSGYIATVSDRKDIPTYSFDLFDRDGKPIETIFSVPYKQQLGLFTLGWSGDERYLAFITFDMQIENGKAYSTLFHYDPHNTLYIADTQNRVVFNTCKAIGEGLAWSPNANTDEITFLTPGDGLKDVLILDMNDYKLYRVAKHTVTYGYHSYPESYDPSDGIIGWREN